MVWFLCTRTPTKFHLIENQREWSWYIRMVGGSRRTLLRALNVKLSKHFELWLMLSSSHYKLCRQAVNSVDVDGQSQSIQQNSVDSLLNHLVCWSSPFETHLWPEWRWIILLPDQDSSFVGHHNTLKIYNYYTRQNLLRSGWGKCKVKALKLGKQELICAWRTQIDNIAYIHSDCYWCGPAYFLHSFI